MTDIRPEMETSDNWGTTELFVGSVGTTPTLVPAVAGFAIEEFSIRCAVDQARKRRLEFSLDGVNYARLKVAETREEEVRGSTIKQIWIRAAGSGVTSVNYEIFLNRADC